MAGLLRMEYPGASDHVMSRGHRTGARIYFKSHSAPPPRHEITHFLRSYSIRYLYRHLSRTATGSF